jgi:hypothetical protein
LPDEPPGETFDYIISRVPPKPYVLLLTNVFFTECSWIYDSVHEGTFRKQLDAWYLAHGNGTRDALHFTCLLLQVLAISCQMLPKKHWKEMAQLTVGKENFKELAREYSSAGCELGSRLIGKAATMSRVQGWFLRACWLKSDGRAVESWHALAHAIRDAHELGLHKDSSPERDMKAGDVVEGMWMRQVEKRVWVNLYVWDR